MTTQKFALATLAGGVTLFVIGGIFYGWLLMDFFNNANATPGAMKETPVWLYLALSELVLAALLTTVIGKWARVGGAGEGFKIGAVFGLLLSVAFGLVVLAVMNVSTPTSTVVDVIVQVVRTSTAGAAIGAVIGRS